MYSVERKTQILNLLEQHGSINVAHLSNYFEASKETIRRDLRELEQDGLLVRTHGGAIPMETKHISQSGSVEPPVKERELNNFQEKQAICKKAVSFIQSDDNVYVDNSSTTIYLAQYVPYDMQVTFITNSIPFLINAAQLNNPNHTYICLGGMLKVSNLSIHGNMTLHCAREYYPNKAFLSCTGISPDRMLTDSSIQEVDIKKMMIERSKDVYILADHSKFEKKGQIYLSSFHDINHIITDSKAIKSNYSYIANYNIDVIVAQD
ncbi:MAG: DeoR family transcriptional regulator [Herbinix sp.]|jgi:DeoR family fructose operon transcriptional repressor|nr:DeoR family transcriptional regulator [Herbinix sp.]